MEQSDSRRLAAVIALASVVVALITIAVRALGSFTGGGADMAHHYALVHWFTQHWTPPGAGDADLASLTDYPPGAHMLGALVGRVVDSPFRGMQLTAVAAVVLIWCAVAALLALLPGRRGWVAMAALAGLLLLNIAGDHSIFNRTASR